MRKAGCAEAQIIGFLREAEAGLPVKNLCRQHGFSEASYYLWRSKFGGMSVSDAKRLKELETENGRLEKLLAESQLEIEVTREVLQKNGGRTGSRLGRREGYPSRPPTPPCVRFRGRNTRLRTYVTPVSTEPFSQPFAGAQHAAANGYAPRNA